MNFAEIVSEVVGITKRPDKVQEISTAINAVISLCTMKASFAKDLVEISLPISSLLYGDTVQFDNVSPLPTIIRFRKFKYIKAPGVRRYLLPIGADQVFTTASSLQLDRYYVGGNNLTYTLKELAQSLEIGYYQYPKVLSDFVGNDTHWMLDIMPYTIIDLSAARIFRSVGDDASFKTHESMGQDAYKINRRDHEDSILVGAT